MPEFSSTGEENAGEGDMGRVMMLNVIEIVHGGSRIAQNKLVLF